MIAALILDKTGFVANVVQNVSVLNGLKAMMSIIPSGVGLLALILLIFYPLDEQVMAKVKTELDAKRKSSSQPVTAA